MRELKYCGYSEANSAEPSRPQSHPSSHRVSDTTVSNCSINAIERPSAPPLTRHESIVFLDTVGIGRMDAAELEQVFVMRKRCRPSRLARSAIRDERANEPPRYEREQSDESSRHLGVAFTF